MSAVQQWASVLCVLVLISAIIQYVIPSGMMERSMKLVLGGFVVLGLILPIADLVRSVEWDFQIKEDPSITEHYLETTNNQIITIAQHNIEQLIAETLREMNISAKNIMVKMDISEDNCIMIEKAVLVIAFSDMERAAAIEEKIWSALGIKAEVVIDGR